MAKLYVIIRRKGSNRFIGAIPAKGKATVSSLKKSLKGNVSKGFNVKIVTASQLKKLIVKMRPRSRVTRSKQGGAVRRRTKRRK